MTKNFCPPKITLKDGTICELYDPWVDKYFCGIISVEVCNYRCPNKIVYSKWRLKLFGIPVGPVEGREFDPNNTRPLPPNHPCPPKIKTGGVDCELSEFWEALFLLGLMKINICIYKCSDCLFYCSRWQTRFFGIPLPWRERTTFPYPI